MKAESIYERPAGGRVIADVMTRHPGKGHPRVLFTHDTLGKFQLGIQKNPFMREKWQLVQQRADEYLDLEPYRYLKVNHRLTVHEPVQEAMLCLSIAYHVTGNSAYAERLWKEIYNCCVVWPNWNPYHFLDTGIVCLGVAVAYDWLYDYWSEEQKLIMEHAIMERAIKTTLEEYLDLPRERAHGLGKTWMNGNNWSFLCTGCVAAGAIAICDSKPEYLERCAVMLGMGLQELEKVLSTYGPDGGYIEGPHYWGVANTYLAYFAMTLMSALGKDYGILKTPGLDKTAFFNFDMMGPGGSFNFSDAPHTFAVYPECLWFAKYYNEPTIQALYRMAHDELGVCEKKPITYIKELLFYTPEMENAQCVPPLEGYYRRVETVTIRDSWDMERGNFIGLHAGENGVPHCHLDCGTFVLDMSGKRFAMDLGIGTYNEPGLWWRYRYSAQGHNTWVVNPGEKLTQDMHARTKIIRHAFGASKAYAVADITDAYASEVDKLHRGVLATENRSVFIVQDEIKAARPCEAYWQMHTAAEIEILPDGKQAVLTMGEDCVLVTLLTHNGAVFEVHSAMPYEGTPYYPVSDNDEKTPKLILHFESLTAETVAVEFQHFRKGQSLPATHIEVKPMSEWEI